MGWNRGYAIFEQTVIGAYDLGKLDEALLAVLLEPYRDTDIDSGGSEDLTAKDGLDVREVVVSILAPDRWAELKPNRDVTIEAAQEAYAEALFDAFDDITDRFGWG